EDEPGEHDEYSGDHQPRHGRHVPGGGRVALLGGGRRIAGPGGGSLFWLASFRFRHCSSSVGSGQSSGLRQNGKLAHRTGGAMQVLVIDNYDSFTFNLVQYLGELGAEPHVVRN